MITPEQQRLDALAAAAWLAEMVALRAADPAAHEAEMCRTAKLHQDEFRNTGKRTAL